MTVPLIVLAVLSVIGGLIGIPESFMTGGDRLAEFLSPVIYPSGQAAEIISSGTEISLMALSSVLVFVMIGFAWSQYRNYKEKETTGFGKILENKWWVDEIYDAIIVRPLNWLGNFLNSFFDKKIVDGIVNGVGRLVIYGGRQLRWLQSGQVGIYVLLMVISMLLFFVFQFFIRK